MSKSEDSLDFSSCRVPCRTRKTVMIEKNSKVAIEMYDMNHTSRMEFGVDSEGNITSSIYVDGELQNKFTEPSYMDALSLALRSLTASMTLLDPNRLKAMITNMLGITAPDETGPSN